MISARGLAHSRTPVVAVTLLTALGLAWGWGTLRPVASISDEASYLLQARIFASGRWTAPARALPDFFEQMHDFVTPVTASKYPPGHALLLAIGIVAGLPILIPLVVGGLTGGLLFHMARRLSGAGTAFLTWIAWLTSPGVGLYGTTFLSETTTALLWLAAWWTLDRWRDSGLRRWLVLLSLLLAWGILARPLTMGVFALFAVASVAGLARRPRAADFAVAAAAGGAVLSLWFVWSVRTTGSWKTTPYALYSRLYFPYEKPGFGLSSAAAEKPFPSEMIPFDNYFRQVHREHTVARIPAIVLARLAAFGRNMWGGRALLIPFFAFGLFLLCKKGAFALATGAGVFLAYLFYAHAAGWSVYYFEILPVLAFVTALGLNRVLTLAANRFHRETRPSVTIPGPAAFLTIVAAGVVLIFSWPQMAVTREGRRTIMAQAQALDREFRDPRFPRAVVFVPCTPDHYPVCLLVNGVSDLDRAGVWFVHDRGPENAILMAAASGRRFFRYSVDGSLRLLPEPGP